jgi:hypothetical protein
VTAAVPDLREQPRLGGSEPLASRVPDARRRRGGKTTDEEYRRFVWRLIVNYDRRIRHGGADVLADAVMLRDTLEMVIEAGVESCRSELWSAPWSEIGQATRMTRQAAQEHWAGAGGARRPRSASSPGGPARSGLAVRAKPKESRVQPRTRDEPGVSRLADCRR